MLPRRQVLVAAVSVALWPLAAKAAPATVGANPQDVANLGTPDHALETKIADLAKAAGLDDVGFAAVDLVKGRTAFLRESELFPMQAVSRLPIAIAFMRMVERGKASLNQKIRLTFADIAPGRSPVAVRLRVRPTNFTARQLIEHMLLNSDNTATDALLRLGGGPEKFQQELNRLGGLEGLRIDRYERDLQPESVGLHANATYADAAKFDEAFEALGAEKQTAALDRYLADPRDTSSPRALALLYFKLLSGHVLELQHTDVLLSLMRRTKTGIDRLNAGMLQGWTLAHRGGQSRTIQGISAVFHDSGLATSKSGNRIVLVVMIKRAAMGAADLARFHSAVARIVLNNWT